MLSVAQLTGRDQSHVQEIDDVGLHPECWAALQQLQHEAAQSGIDLQVASGFRSFDRQLLIWNGKARGERPVYDDVGRLVDMQALSEWQQVQAILRFSALPGASRHHWGTDLDVYDAAAMPGGYQLQLSPGEYADSGVFGALHNWLQQRIDGAESFGFWRPYLQDRGGVAVERWHLSYAPLAEQCAAALDLEQLRDCLVRCDMALAEVVMEKLEQIYQSYVVPPAA